MNIGQLLRTAPFGVWMYLDLLHISGNFNKAAKHKAAGDLDREKEEIRKAEFYWSTSLEKKIGARLHITGKENLPENAALYVSNHQSYCDIAAMMLLSGRQIGFIAKDELQKLPLFGRYIKQTRSVFINRGDSRESLKAIEEGTQYLQQGFNLAIFPEGTRSKGPQMGEFKKGALRPAFKAEAPVVPVTIHGSYHLWEEKGYPCDADVVIHIHPPVETKGLKKSEQNAAADEVERMIREKLAELQANS